MSSFELKSNRPTIVKDPDSYLDYTLDLTQWLADINDTIASAETTSVGVTVEQVDVVNGTKIIAWVSGGMAGQDANVTYRFTTVAGRIDERTIYFTMKER